MNIWIDTRVTRGCDGKVSAYYPEVHWTLDDQDSVSPEMMNRICARLKNELEEGLYIERDN